MPLPLIPILVGAAVVGTSGLVAGKLRRNRLAGERIVILGRSQAGKSTLRDRLQAGGEADSEDRSPSRKRFALIANEKPASFVVPEGFSGFQGLGFDKWERAFLKSDHVWYLFRADLIALGDPEEVERVRHDLDMFKSWIVNRKHQPQFMLVGTWADQAPQYASDPKGFARFVSAAVPLDTGLVKLGNASVVIGSLATSAEARRLIKDIRSNLE